MRQLGKTTAFQMMSANEICWPHLLVILHWLNNYYKDIIDLDESNIFEKLNRSMGSTLVNEDTVTCVYFKKMVDVIMTMLKNRLRNRAPTTNLSLHIGNLPTKGEKCELNIIVTNMESRFPAVRVLWLGREFYRGKYEMTDSSHVWTPDIGDKFGDEIWDLKGAGIFSTSLLAEEIRLNVLEDSM
ncbi:hypothetical protein AVEN_219473-1 [Araneus ventricosus]|uniref:Uncharacterized protein n=1 Tax=Araneus ventricosus TaxID=182803 RepID=A0A4Y2BNS7_ARAVE|nr:hypothetical protein AVEN_219473-1 [Araneus ventricosus]